MHHEIIILVFADNSDDAFELANVTLEDIVEKDDTFDYGTILEDGIYEPVKASSPEGEEIIKVMLDRTRSSFYEVLGRIRNALETFCDVELWEKKVRGKIPSSAHNTMVEMFRYNCLCIGRTSGRYTDIYDQDGNGIRTPGHLENVLGGWGDQGRGDRCWIVWADVHC